MPQQPFCSTSLCLAVLKHGMCMFVANSNAAWGFSAISSGSVLYGEIALLASIPHI